MKKSVQIVFDTSSIIFEKQFTDFSYLMELCGISSPFVIEESVIIEIDDENPAHVQFINALNTVLRDNYKVFILY